MTEVLGVDRLDRPHSSFDRVLAAVHDTGLRHKITNGGTHIQAECPTHADNQPSLSIDYKPEARSTFLHCQAQCHPDEVLAALELTTPMLYDDYEDPETFRARRAREREHERRNGGRASTTKPRRAPAKKAKPPLPKGKMPGRVTKVYPRPLEKWSVTMTYDYCDAEGLVIHQEVRRQRLVEVTDPETGATSQKIEKKFIQLWPDDKGGWLEKTPPGFVPVLYRLPDLSRWISEGRRIWLCEGAKDAERFDGLGEAATTNPSGGGNFKPAQAASLTGAHVVAVLDHDLAGYRRGLKLSRLLRDVASLRLVLPVTSGRHEDASDHFDAGNGLEDFVDVTLEELRELEQVADAEDAALLGDTAAAEAAARAARAIEASSKIRRDTETRFAGWWAAQAGKQLVRSVTALEVAVQNGPGAKKSQEQLLAAVRSCQGAVTSAHKSAGVAIPEQFKDYLEEPSFPAVEEIGHAAAAEPADENTGSVIDHPTATRFPEPDGDFPMSRGRWAYELGGEGRRARGVYLLENNRWVRVAPLPYLHARIVSRDGYGRPMGHYYLVSGEADSVKVTIGHDELAKHTWPNILGLAISQDDKILKAATTALIFAAEDETELVEATPRVTEDGRIALPVPETLPHGYLATSPLDRVQALGVWGDLVRLASESPRLALVLGASAFGPFLAALGNRQPHIVSLHGDMAQGKSVTMRTAASMWGYPGSKAEAGVCESWNQSKLAPTSYLGELGVLPAFFDEIGMAGNLSAADWGKRIFDICEGASRGRPAANGRPGFVRGRSWYGILLSAGNSRLMDGIGAGGMAGTQRRVVELSTPFTHSREHSDAIEDLYPQAYGHLGAEILARHSAATVQQFLDYAAELLGPADYDSPVAQEIVKHLVSHIAGAAIIDDLVGSSGLLAAAATDGALEYLSEWEEPLHDADRLLDAIHDSLFQEPACWPSVAQHLENIQAPNFHDSRGSEIARHGVALKTKGLVGNDQDWLAVFPGVWEELCKDLGVDSDVACRELTQREVLIRQGSSHKPGARNNTSVIRVGKSAKRFYKLTYPVLDNPDEAVELPLDESPQGPDDGSSPTPASVPMPTTDDVEVGQLALSPPVTASVTPERPNVTAPVTAPTGPLTCDVTAVTAVTAPLIHVGAHEEDVNDTEPQILRFGPDEQSLPCVVCGIGAGQTVDGKPLHLGPCADLVNQIEAAPTTAETRTNETQQAPSSSTSPKKVADRAQRGARFTAPAAVLDGEGIHLADGSVRPFPTITHLGELAALTGREALRLGWGGGEDRLPDQGQIWLTAGALEHLGLPVELPAFPDKALTKGQRAKASAKIYSRLDNHPLVAGAVEAGWELGQGGHLDVWTRIWHRELLPQGAFLVGLPWHRIDGVALFGDNPTPGELARRLLIFAQNVGVSYRITSAATGLDLIDHHRPPRRDVDDDRGQSRRRVSLVRHTPAEIPPWRMKTTDARFTGLEQDFSWWRPWENLGETEKGLRYVHGYDRNASYLVPWRSLELGVEDLIHRTGEAAAWDGKEKPGYYLIEVGWEWTNWGLPDPGTAAGARVGKNRAWVTVHTLKQLKAHGITPTVHESYTWGVTARYLEGPGTALGQARMALSPVADADPGTAAVLATIKTLYSATVGKLAEREHRGDFHLWRPDWRDHVIGATKTAILHTVTKAQELSGSSPLVVDRDAIFYASDEADPVAAWPGDPAKLDGGLGSWKPIGAAELSSWGPQFLTQRAGRWHYADAMDAMKGEVEADA